MNDLLNSAPGITYLIGAGFAALIGGVLLNLAFSDYFDAPQRNARKYAARALLWRLLLVPLAVLLWPLTLVVFLLCGASVLVDDAFGNNE